MLTLHPLWTHHLLLVPPIHDAMRILRSGLRVDMQWLALFLLVALARLCNGVRAAPHDSESLHETVHAYLNSGGRELYQRRMNLAPGIEYNPLANFHVDHAPLWYSRERASDLEVLHAMGFHVPGVDSPRTIRKRNRLDLTTTARQINRNINGPRSSYGVTFLNDPPPEIQQAFLHAIRIWSSTFPCTPRIRVQFLWQRFARRGTLAAAGTSFSILGGSKGLQAGISYMPTMATAITGQDIFRGGDEFHVSLVFNADLPWWSDVSRDAPSRRFDFATIALHELCHGLFFAGALQVPPGTSAVRYASRGERPARFDQFIQLSNGIGIAQSCNQRELYQALTRRGLSFRTSEQNSSFWLFAPSDYRPGSSTYHLDAFGLKQSCKRYGIRDADCSDLMTFEVRPGHTQREIGEPVLRIMRSILGSSTGLVKSETCNVPEALSGPTDVLGSLSDLPIGRAFRIQRWVVIVASSIAAIGAALLLYFVITTGCCKS